MSKSSIGWRKAGISSLATAALVAGACVAGAGAANATTNFNFTRVAGHSRYDTSVAVADQYGNVKNVILASGESGHYADALVAAFLSGNENAPILLTKKDTTPDVVTQQLQDMGATDVWIIGDDNAISQSQEDALAKNYTVHRLGGHSRYDTAADVMGAATGTGDTAILATGENFPDALGAGPLSYAQDMPIAITRSDRLPDATLQALKDANIKQVIVLGGTTAVSQNVIDQLNANGITVKDRVWGTSRDETAAALAKYEVNHYGFSVNGVNVASGFDLGGGADALSGGPLTGKQDRPMLITKNSNKAGSGTLDYLKANANTLTDGIIFGSDNAVSQAIEDAMVAAARTAPASATSLPELRSAHIVKTVTADQATSTNPVGTYVTYTFDEKVLSHGTADQFKVYHADSTAVPGTSVEDLSGNTVTVRFAGLVNTAKVEATNAKDLTVATVTAGAVTDEQGQSSPAGDAAIGTSVAPGGGTTLAAGVTDAPDLVSVGNFHEATPSGTAVDFTFDQDAYTTATPVFKLIPTDGSAPITGTAPVATDTTTPAKGSLPGGNGTTTITVVFATSNLKASDFARGAVAANSVSDKADDYENALETADISNGGNTSNPDLVSAKFMPNATDSSGNDIDQVLYTFDNNVVNTPSAGDFNVYYTDGTEQTGSGNVTINPANHSQVLVDFADGDLTDAVGASVAAGAVDGPGATQANDVDEVGVTGTAGSTAGQEPGSTDAPDLTGVSISRAASDPFGNPGYYQVTYTFDQDVTNATQAAFNLYEANGAKVDLSGADIAVGNTEDTDNTVTITATDKATSDDIASAVLGTVAQDAVNGVSDASTKVGTASTSDGTQNPEGAEFTSGGTGTPSA